MKRLFADFNAETADGRISLDTVGSRESLRGLGEALRSGERVVLSDGEMEVEATLEARTVPAVPGYTPTRQVWVAVLDDTTWRDAAEVQAEIAAADFLEPLWRPLVETQLTA